MVAELLGRDHPPSGVGNAQDRALGGLGQDRLLRRDHRGAHARLRADDRRLTPVPRRRRPFERRSIDVVERWHDEAQGRQPQAVIHRGHQDRLADAALGIGRPDVDPPGAAARSGRLDRLDQGERAQHRRRALDVGRRRQLELDLDDRRAIAELGCQLRDGALPDEPPRGEDPDPVAHRLDLGQQVAREHDREAAFVDELAEQVQDLDDAERVDRGGRLVEDEQVRRLDQRVGDAEPLAHAA